MGTWGHGCMGKGGHGCMGKEGHDYMGKWGKNRENDMEAGGCGKSGDIKCFLI